MWTGVRAAEEPLGWQAEQAEKDGNIVRAWLLYSQAAALEPNNRKYAGKALSLRMAALDKSQIVVSRDPLTLPDLDPRIVQSIPDKEIAELRRLLPPVDLKPKPGRRAFDFAGPVRNVVEKTLEACGIGTVVDSGFDATQTIRLRLDDASCAEAIQGVELLGGIFLSPISETLALVVRETAEKRREQDRTAAISVPLPETYTVQEAQEAARSVQQTLEIQRLAVDPTRRIVVIRDRAWKVKAGALILTQLMTRRPEVVVDVEFMQIARQRDTRFGLDLQTMTQIVNFGGLWNSPIAAPGGFTAFLTFGGGLTLFGIGITDYRVFASMTDTRATILQRSTLRSLDNQAATLHVGDRFPIATQVYVGGEDLDPSVPLFRPPPQIQFEDLGLTLKITPRVHGAEDVTLNIESEFKVLTSQSSNGIPVISNRKYLGQVRLRSGEWAVAAGLTTRSLSQGYTGLVGLSQIPGAGIALRNNTRSRTENEVLIVLKPRVLHGGPAEYASAPIWVGTEGRPLPPL